MRPRALSCLLSLLAACGGDAGGGPDALVTGDGWTELLAADWQLAAQTEKFYCARLTLEQDLLVTGFRPLAPLGTHHTAAVVGPPSGPDDSFDCEPDEAGNFERVLFAAGVGTDDLVFPDGVALEVAAGQQILLNLHLYNTGDQALSGRSGMLVRTAQPAEVPERAAILLTAAETPSIPPHTTSATATSDCTFAAAATLVDLWPHMHQIGRHMRVELAGDLLLDQPYAFTEQTHYAGPHAVRAGDVLRHTCSWTNDSDVTVEPGNSSDQEMCILGAYVVPATAVPDCPGL